MHISYKKLGDFLPKVRSLSPDEVAEILTSLGLEVEGVSEVEAIRGGLKGVVIGEVEECLPHPNSDHLHITKVNVGEDKPLSIVCGAPNVARGQKVLVATIGTVLYEGDKSFTIKKSKLRGEESFGMICSEKELALGEDSSGIKVLPEDAPVGMPAASYFEIESDYCLEIDITPNRVDAASHFGVARDIAAYFSARGEHIKAILPEIPDLSEEKQGKGVPVELLTTPEECPRYSGITLSGLKNRQSPKEITQFLRTLGLNPHNLIVDISNVVLHEIGQPIHIFDADRIEGNLIKVQKLASETPFTTLDGVKHSLSGKELMITNAQDKPICMAGIMGGKEAEVTLETQQIFIESANFNSTLIRKAARYHGLNSDSSFRFERGLDPKATDYALRYAVELIRRYIPEAKIEGTPLDLRKIPFEESRCTLSLSYLERLLGGKIPLSTVKIILESLDIKVEKEDPETLYLLLPGYRTDVRRPADVAEEILRIYGYNELPLSGYITANLSTQGDQDRDYHTEIVLSEQLVGAGYSEILCNSLTAEKYYEGLTSLSPDLLVHLQNPLSRELAVLRQTLLFGGLESIARNLRNKQPSCAFFEWGSSYRTSPAKKEVPQAFNAGKQVLKGFEEVPMLGLWLSGSVGQDNWNSEEKPFSAFHLKGDVENIFLRLGIPLKDLTQRLLPESDLFTTELQYVTKGELCLARLGEVSPSLLRFFDIDSPIYFAELRKDLIFEMGRHSLLEVEDINKFPIVTRDFALLIDEKVTFLELLDTAYKAGGKILRDVRLFDVYKGENLPKGKISYALRFKLQDDKGTLQEKQIEKIMTNIRTLLENELGATIR